jgi:crotonobetainyl-CoA:carnitine CoA-transferase CaiB-like acyl-CoA transferase
MSGPLDGLLILDLTQQLVGPGATMLLGDMGADVIRVDPPPSVAGRNADLRPRTSLNMGRSKRNICVDLNTETGREIVYDLARRADVVVQNYRPGLAALLGVDYESIRRVNPRIIYCEINAYGAKGSDRHRVGFDIIAQGGGGSMVPSWQNPDLPAPVSAPIADVTGLVLAALGIVAAVHHRSQTGEGQAVRTSLLDGVVLQGILRLISIENESVPVRQAMLEAARKMVESGASFADVANATATGMGGQPTGSTAGAGGMAPNVYYRTYRTKDSFIAIGCLNVRQQRRLDAALELGDPRFSDAGTAPDSAEYAELLKLQRKAEAIFLQRTTSEWIDYLDSKQIACGPVLNLLELFDSPHHLENEMVVECEDPWVGKLRLLGYPIKFERTPMRMQRPAPLPGQYTDELLAWLGYDETGIRQLKSQSVVF